MASTIVLQFMASFDLPRTMIAASIWLIFLPSGVDSLGARLATGALLVAILVVGTLVVFLALRAVAVALVVLVLVVIALVSVGCNGLAAIIRPGEPPPSDARRRFGTS